MSDITTVLAALEAELRRRGFFIRRRTPSEFDGDTIWRYTLERDGWHGGFEYLEDFLTDDALLEMLPHYIGDDVEESYQRERRLGRRLPIA